jgi:mono/diheme cytochrome c family protein
MKPRLSSLLLMLAVALPGATVRADDAADQHFTARVLPLLELRCVSCHGPDKVKGGLRMDSREALLKGGENGPAIVPGKPAESLLLQAVMHSKKDLEMPPKEKLTTNDIAVLEKWITDGAPWPKSAVVSAAAPKAAPGERIGDAWQDARNPIVRIFGGQRLDLWSFKPLRRDAPPVVRNKRWARNPIDQFILQRLEAAGVSPALEADKRSLARRLYFDLTGLPPTPEDVQRFLADRRPDAYERLVDTLLASPRYGEHQARAWLDVIRYSDSNGYDWDEFRPRAWRFRDYVVRAFNEDKPFDVFIREQLAGDELLDGPPRNQREQDALIATGYLRLGPQDNSAGAFNEQDRARSELLTDLTETTASALLGLTMSCCRCHDHKFDPLSQADHFRMRAFFEPVKYADETPLDLDSEQEAIRKNNAALEKELQPVQQQRDEILDGVKQRMRAERVAKLSTNEQALLALPKEQRTNDVAKKIEALEKKVEVSSKDAKAAFKDDEKGRFEKLEKDIAALNAKKRAFTLGLLMSDGTNKAAVTRIHFQGDHKQPKDIVEPGFPSALDPNPAALRTAVNRRTTGRRLTLADWITSPQNPLTSRVLVNRAWQNCFGHGLVATANDFGLAGERPTHPELLDWLAGEFMRRGWSWRELQRLIVTSAAYRGSSRSVISESVISKPALVAHQPSSPPLITDSLMTDYSPRQPRRLSAEQLRDALLSVSGLLTGKTNGPPVWPDLPPEILQANPAFLDDNETKTKGWYPSPAAEQHARSLFLVQKRTVRVPFMETFDLPENSVSCARRTESTVAPQALSLLNSPLAVEAARAFAARVTKEAGGDPHAQISRAFALALQREPLKSERELCERLIQRRKLPELCRALLNLNEFLYLD